MRNAFFLQRTTGRKYLSLFRSPQVISFNRYKFEHIMKHPKYVAFLGMLPGMQTNVFWKIFNQVRGWTEILAVLDMKWKLWKRINIRRTITKTKKVYHILLCRSNKKQEDLYCDNPWRWIERPLLRKIHWHIQWPVGG